MEQFPLNFTRAKCYEKMEKSQAELLKMIRQTFYDSITSSVDDCVELIILEFPNKLWNTHRITLVRELLERFGKMRVECAPGKIVKHEMAKPFLTLTDKIPENIKKITINLYEE
jgi:hypothetical protein